MAGPITTCGMVGFVRRVNAPICSRPVPMLKVPTSLQISIIRSKKCNAPN